MTIIVGGACQNSGTEHMTETRNVSSSTNKTTGGRVVKLSTTGEYIQKVTAITDAPYGIVVGEIGKTSVNNYSLSECICTRGRGVYAELDSAVTSITAGANAYITASGTITDSDAGSYIGVFMSSTITEYSGKKTCLLRVG